MESLNKPNPVLLIHGIFDTIRIFNKMSRYLKKLGWEVDDKPSHEIVKII